MIEKFGKYELIERIGLGGMAEIFLARHGGEQGFTKEVAIKRIFPHLIDDPQIRAMFLDEAKIASGLNHPNIVKIYDLGELEDYLYLAMEFVRGKDLRAVCERGFDLGKFVPIPMAVLVVASAAAGLHHAHEFAGPDGPMNIVHRDISPQNILVGIEGSVKVCDFGIAKAEQRLSHTQAGQTKGKYAYMSPEQLESTNVDARSDVFALGIVLYELASCSRLFRGETDIETIRLVASGKIVPPHEVRTEVHPDLSAIIMRALERDPEKRYQTAREFQLALVDWLGVHHPHSTDVHVAAYMEGLFPEMLKTVAENLPERTKPIDASALVAMDEAVSMDAADHFKQMDAAVTMDAADHFKQMDSQTPVSVGDLSGAFDMAGMEQSADQSMDIDEAAIDSLGGEKDAHSRETAERIAAVAHDLSTGGIREGAAPAYQEDETLQMSMDEVEDAMEKEAERERLAAQGQSVTAQSPAVTEEPAEPAPLPVPSAFAVPDPALVPSASKPVEETVDMHATLEPDVISTIPAVDEQLPPVATEAVVPVTATAPPVTAPKPGPGAFKPPPAATSSDVPVADPAPSTQVPAQQPVQQAPVQQAPVQTTQDYIDEEPIADWKPSTSKRGIFTVVAFIALIATGLTVLYIALNTESQLEKDAAAANIDPKLLENAGPEPLDLVSATITSEPAGAKLVVNGNRVKGTTQLVANHTNEVIAYLDGHAPRRKEISGSAGNHVLTLSPLETEPDTPIAIVSEPVGANVFVNGKPSGKTPTTLTLSSKVEHHISIEADGHFDHSAFVALVPKLENEMVVKLHEKDSAKKAYTDLEFEVIPRQTVVTVDGISTGMTPFFKTYPRYKFVSVQLSETDSLPMTRRLYLSEMSTFELRTKLAKAKRDKGTISVRVEPKGADLYVGRNGYGQGPASKVSLPEGNVLVVVDPGGGRLEGKIKVEPNVHTKYVLRVNGKKLSIKTE